MCVRPRGCTATGHARLQSPRCTIAHVFSVRCVTRWMRNDTRGVSSARAQPRRVTRHAQLTDLFRPHEAAQEPRQREHCHARQRRRTSVSLGQHEKACRSTQTRSAHDCQSEGPVSLVTNSTQHTAVPMATRKAVVTSEREYLPLNTVPLSSMTGRGAMAFMPLMTPKLVTG